MFERIFLFLLLFATPLGAQIVETDRFGAIVEYADRETLLILDIDNTLLMPEQELGSDAWFHYRIEWYKKQGYEAQEALERAIPEFEAIQNITRSRTVEQTTSQIIRALQNRGFTVIGLTSRGLALATRTGRQLQEHAIDLSLTAPTSDDVPLFNPRVILFRRGVFYTAGTDKGEALMKLFSHIEYYPKRIVFINDHKAHLVQVEEACEKAGIPFIGLRYSYLDEKVHRFRSDIADMQFEHFKNILSDHEALSLIQMKGDPTG